MGYLYKYFGMGGVPKIPLIKNWGRHNCKGKRSWERTVLINIGRYGARIGDALFLGLQC